MNILDHLADAARDRVEKAKALKSAETIRKEACAMRCGNFEFETAIKKHRMPGGAANGINGGAADIAPGGMAVNAPGGMAFICECKKASPSKGLIAREFPYVEIAKEYEAAGADCISVLTEPYWFLGSDLYLREIAAAVSIPCIRKDFTVDEYMIYEAKLLGASAVLLICSILDGDTIKRYIGICDELGLSALVEAHDEREIETALGAGARMIGVNNRNLKDFTVDTENSRKLRNLIPRDVIFVSESGVSTANDIALLKQAGVDAVLIGEALMRAPDKKKKLDEFKAAL